MLRSLHMRDVGPAGRLDLELGERLNVLTGDNGLGKSFVLEAAWWALTDVWARRSLWARPAEGVTPTIEWELTSSDGAAVGQMGSARVDQTWARSEPRWGSADLVIYASADNTFAVWDAARSYQTVRSRAPEAYCFDAKDLWYGLQSGDRRICNGLIQDWVTWQLEADAGRPHAFRLLADVLSSLSHPDEPMTPGTPERLFLDDSRNYPVIDLPYGKIPVIHASAGMQRILGLSYLLTWSWIEHVAACRLLGRKPAERIVFLMDEIESHLHPKWQRQILPSLLDVLAGLGPNTASQVLVTTHSPLVLASLEPHFNETKDKLFLFELAKPAGHSTSKEVTLREVPWAKRGDAGSWLTSPVFGLAQARSPEAERAIEAAYDYMAGRGAELPEGLETADQLDRELRRLLPDQDKFWPRWVVYRERKSA